MNNTSEKTQLQRTSILYGDAAMEGLKFSRVAVFGVGGVGGYVVEALVRSGIGAIDIIDNDVVDITNINRQIIALHDTIGRYKVDVFKERIASINCDCKVKAYKFFVHNDTINEIDFLGYDYVVDAIDTVSGKLCIIEKAKALSIPIISAMGAGNRISPFGFEFADIYDTKEDALARVMRRECRKRGIEALTVLYSKEKGVENHTGVTGSVSFVVGTAGMLIASKVINDLVEG